MEATNSTNYTNMNPCFVAGAEQGNNIAATCVLCIASVLGSIGNFWVVVIFGPKKSKTVSDHFIFSLAIVDLITSTVYLPYMLTIMNIPEQHLPICVTDELLSNALTWSSLFILLEVTVDRYLAVCRAHQYRSISTVQRAKVIIIIAILLSMLLSSPIVIVCLKSFEQVTVWYRYLFLATVLLLCTVMVIVYAIILLKLNSQKKKRQNMRGAEMSITETVLISAENSNRPQANGKEAGDAPPDGGAGAAENHKLMSPKPASHKDSSRGRSVKSKSRGSQEQRTAIMLCVVTIVFIVLYVPSAVIMTVVDHCVLAPYPGLLGTIAPIFYLNLPANPLIYMLMSSRFRADSMATLRRWRSRF